MASGWRPWRVPTHVQSTPIRRLASVSPGPNLKGSGGTAALTHAATPRFKQARSTTWSVRATWSVRTTPRRQTLRASRSASTPSKQRSNATRSCAPTRLSRASSRASAASLSVSRVPRRRRPRRRPRRRTLRASRDASVPSRRRSAPTRSCVPTRLSRPSSRISVASSSALLAILKMTMTRHLVAKGLAMPRTRRPRRARRTRRTRRTKTRRMSRPTLSCPTVLTSLKF